MAGVCCRSWAGLPKGGAGFRLLAPSALRAVRPFSLSARAASSSSSSAKARVAVLHQALEPPIINGTRKPMKPGGYQDSGADIAFNLRNSGQHEVLCPVADPDPAVQEGWSFPDTEAGILAAVDGGATHLWANTILFASHPLQTSARLTPVADTLRVVGQGPLVVDQYDDKDYVNTYLRGLGDAGRFTLPRAWSVPASLAGSALQDTLAAVPQYPVVAKPARGRGSYGVKVCRTPAELDAHVQWLQGQLMSVIVEEFLAGEEATVTVMPPPASVDSGSHDYWSLPVAARDPAYARVQRECEAVARLLGTTAPIRVDVRRFQDAPGAPFALFDINMKPNMTGPGRPGRADQASLTLLAAAALGWDYQRLLAEILKTAATLKTLRTLQPVTNSA
ncbi:d-alanine ligase [Niveomyces insectorum RCEF 264]|uniref:D-alanine ligase n=1 Tax=Niveomyces insectorum RCEF 264 TaxID=1081102 RepID=A0A167SP02_9HYPO|nr:d-alanine ligase [Niveomyces insectorum RCEF 264]